MKITQKSAWFVLHRIREVYKAEKPTFNKPVEIDETYVGGKAKNKHAHKRVKNSLGRSTKTKTPVIGIIERDGKVYALPVKKTDKATIKHLVNATVKLGTTVYTDEWRSYNVLNKEYNREVIQHSAGEYVKGQIHTNNIENFWSHFKRGIFGIYHQVSDKHLESYVNEYTYRYNRRTLTDGSRFDLTLANSQKRLTYNDLIKKGA